MHDDRDFPVTERLGGRVDGVTQRMPSAKAVTQRLPVNAGVTQRLDDGEQIQTAAMVKRVTARLRDDSALMSVLQLQAGIQVVDRYRIEAGPLGGISGEAEIYRCLDERSGLPVVLKLYRHNMAPREEVLKHLLGLNHPDIVSIKDYGTWSGRFYEVMEFCAGGAMADAMPLSEIELREHIPQIALGLNYCHRQGIIHRDIKPSNLFFRDTEHRDSVLGDFGISSILDVDKAGVRITQTAANLTLDYAAPELLDGHSVGPQTDYYSLGITLIHSLLGHSPFLGMSNTDILVAHLRGRVRVPEHLSPEFAQLIHGLLQVDPDNRWGYRQIHAWLHGEAIVTDDGRAWQQQVSAEAAVGYPGFPAAQTPQQLAAALSEFDAAKQLFRGDIRRWVFDHFDAALAERIEEIEENYTHDPALGVQKLRFLLDPTAPLQVGQRQLCTPKDLLDLLLIDDAEINESLTELLFGGLLAVWLDTLVNLRDRARLVSKVSLMSEQLRYQDPALALFSLRCILDPSQPLPLVGDITVSRPGNLEKVLRSHPAAVTALVERIEQGYLEQWLRIAEFTGWEEDVKFIKNCRIVYFKQAALLAKAVRWRFQPTLPFSFAGKAVADPKQLAILIDRDAQSRKLGLKLLREGWLGAWLVSTGRIVDPTALDQVLWDTLISEESKLEALLQLMNPALGRPCLSVGFSRINFGRVSIDSPRSKIITLRNA
ncbi:MAG: serine/threonine-protein kinase, partial [Chromatiales bacterium]